MPIYAQKTRFTDNDYVKQMLATRKSRRQVAYLSSTAVFCLSCTTSRHLTHIVPSYQICRRTCIVHT
jgi:hypothetical protein